MQGIGVRPIPTDVDVAHADEAGNAQTIVSDNYSESLNEKKATTVMQAKQRIGTAILIAIFSIGVVVPIATSIAVRLKVAKKDDTAMDLQDHNTNDDNGAVKELLSTELPKVSDQIDLMDANSPQYKARQWLENEDKHIETLSSTWQLHQRYALVTLYYATSGPSWTQRVSFLNKLTSECMWKGILCTKSRVYSVDLSFKNLTGQLPSEIRLVSSIGELRLEDNSITGIIPQSIAQLRNLVHLDLSGNQITGKIPPSLWTLDNLRSIYLSNNSLTGKIDNDPGEKQRLPSIQQLFLGKNNLSGHIPSWIAKSQYLEHLSLGNNDLSGKLKDFESARSDAESSGTKALKSLTLLDLSRNQLSGTLPPELIQYNSYPGLEHLYLDHNSLSGAIPEGRQHNVLTILRLNSNQFEGTISRDFGYNASQLEVLLLQDNIITGAITQCNETGNGTATYWPNLEILEADCHSLVMCSCCTDCHG